MWTRSDLTRDLRALGVRPGDVIMAHASVRSFGGIAGGPDEIHLAIKDAITPQGTLFMFASCPDYVDEVGRGEHPPELEAEILAKLPPFDPRTARSARDNGALVELFRTYPGSRVNDHVARFVVWGKETERLLVPQPWDLPFGHGSLLERFMELDGKVLLLGSDHDTVTFLHYTEHVADFPDKRVVTFKVPVLEKGQRVWRDVREYDTSTVGVHPNWPHVFFARITDAYLVKTANAGGRVGNSFSHLINARGLHEFAAPIMQAVAADPRAADVLPTAPLRGPPGTQCELVDRR